MYKALIDTDSIKDKNWLNTLNVVGEYDEKWPGEEFPLVHILKVLVKEEDVNDFINKISKSLILDEWFAVIWNDKEVFVALKNKIFKLNNPPSKDKINWEKLIEYGKKNNIDKKYFLNMEKVIGK